MNLLKHKSKAARFKFEDNFLTTVKAIRGRELDVSREIGRLQAVLRCSTSQTIGKIDS